MKNRYKYIFLIAFTLLLSCSGCGKNVKDTRKEIYYNPYIQKLILYSNEDKNFGMWNSTKNQFQYSVDNNNLYIDGNSINNNFKLLELRGNSIKKLFNFPNNESFFPLGRYGDKIYLTHYFYNDDGKEKIDKRRISIYDIKTSKFTDFKKTTGLIDYGVLTMNEIYYTIYDVKKDRYSLMKIRKEGINDAPELVRSELKDGVILANENELYYSDGEKLISSKKQYKKEPVNFFHSKILYQFYVDDNEQLCIRITNTQNNNVITEVDVLGIRIMNNKVKVCKLDGVKIYDL